MSQVQFSVGTSPVIIANGNASRTSVTITVLPSSIASGNTGVVYVLKGGAPTATAGSPASGDALSQGSQWVEAGQYSGDPNVFKGQVWAVADTAAQQITVDESYAN